MNVDEVLAELATLGHEDTRRIWLKHGAPAPFFGVKIEDLKKLVRRIKVDQALALALWESGNSDARYLAALISDPAAFIRDQLRHWADTAGWHMLSEYSVAWCAAESPHGRALAREWIQSPRAATACSGWATWSSLLAITPDERLDLAELRGLLGQVRDTLPGSPGRLPHVMNGFLIAAGGCVPALTEEALAVARALGRIRVDMGGTDCRTPDAVAYIEKLRLRGVIGKKRKSVRC
ncbi:MAG: DNA alkylation repair protein [Candidatus Delongbacteria bacterium]